MTAPLELEGSPGRERRITGIPRLASFWRFALPLLGTFAVYLLERTLFPAPSIAPFVFFYVPVAAISWLGGRVPGLLTVALSAAVANHEFIEPARAWATSGPALQATLLFLIAASVVAWLCAGFRDAVIRAEGVAETVRRQAELGRRTEDALRRRELQFRALLANLNAGVALIDAAGRFTLFNERFLDLFGFARGTDVLNVNSRDWSAWQVFDEHRVLLDVDDHPVRRATLAARPVRDQLVGVRVPGSGDLRWMLVSATPLLDEGGAIEYVICTYHDITDRRRIEEALRESEEHLRRASADLSVERAKLEAIIHTLPVGIGITDPRGNPLSMNEAALRLHGFSSQDEMLTQLEMYPDVIELFDLAGRPVPFEDWPGPRAARGDFLHDRELRLRNRRAGSERIIATSVVPLHDAAGQVALLVCLMQDVTERRQVEEVLRAADKSKNDFLAMLSHELRNPLAPIRNSLYVLERSAPGSDHAKRALRIMDRQVLQLTRLVDDLLDINRISRGKIRLQRETLVLNEVVRRAAEDMHAQFDASGVRLDLDVTDEPLRVHGDRVRIAQAIGNLLQNAAKFTPRGGWTRLSLRHADGEAVVEVRDDGIGIEPKLLSRLFDSFVQDERSLDRARGGLGLGLSLVKGLTELHGGTVTALSEGTGRGATFTVRLPLVGPATPYLPATARPDARRPAKRVLVIEDNLDTATSLKEVLELNGHTVDLATSGREGLGRARASVPQVVLCDVGLPDVDGYEIARTLRADPRFDAVLLVALSGYALPEDVERSEDAGFDAHMAKPPSLEGLERMLAERPGRATAG